MLLSHHPKTYNGNCSCHYFYPNLADFRSLQELQIPIQTQLIHLKPEVMKTEFCEQNPCACIKLSKSQQWKSLWMFLQLHVQPTLQSKSAKQVRSVIDVN